MEMLTKALRAFVIVYSFRKVFMGKEKKAINDLIAYSNFHKSDIKNFLKWFINNCPKGTYFFFNF